MSADKKNRFRSFAVKLCAAGLTIVVAGLGYLYAMPKIYRATAKVTILKSGWNNTNDANSMSGPERLPAECQIIRSNAILDQTIQNLNLNQLWGKQYNQGNALKTDESRERLKGLLNVHPAPIGSVIEVEASGADPVQLAQIVNEITRLYADFRQTGRVQASHQGISVLRKKWEAQSQKVQSAQSALNRLADQFNRERATNSVQIYDAGALESLQTERAAVEDDYLAKSNQLAKLKGLSRDELKDVLSKTDTNSVLAGPLQQLAKAKADLKDAQTTHGPDAPETKSAGLVVSQLDHRIDALTDSVMSMRELELSSLKTALDRMKNMSEKAAHATNDTARFAEQDTAYAKAKQDLQKSIKERDELEREIIGNGSMSAVMPDVITAQIMELADAPTKPVSPDARVARTLFIAGGVVAGTGLFLLVLLQMKPRGAEKKTA